MHITKLLETTVSLILFLGHIFTQQLAKTECIRQTIGGQFAKFPFAFAFQAFLSHALLQHFVPFKFPLPDNLLYISGVHGL